jgi:hypothetical protein
VGACTFCSHETYPSTGNNSWCTPHSRSHRQLALARILELVDSDDVTRYAPLIPSPGVQYSDPRGKVMRGHSKRRIFGDLQTIAQHKSSALVSWSPLIDGKRPQRSTTNASPMGLSTPDSRSFGGKLREMVVSARRNGEQRLARRRRASRMP